MSTSVTSPTTHGEVGTRAVRVCALTDLVAERGSVALIDGVQVALIRTHDGAVHAVANLDPYSGAPVIARGLVGTRRDAPTVISPMYKQVWDLRTGECLDGAGREPVSLRTWPVSVVDGQVMVEHGPVEAADEGPGNEATVAPFGISVA